MSEEMIVETWEQNTAALLAAFGTRNVAPAETQRRKSQHELKADRENDTETEHKRQSLNISVYHPEMRSNSCSAAWTPPSDQRIWRTTCWRGQKQGPPQMNHTETTSMKPRTEPRHETRYQIIGCDFGLTWAEKLTFSLEKLRWY